MSVTPSHTAHNITSPAVAKTADRTRRNGVESCKSTFLGEEHYSLFQTLSQQFIYNSLSNSGTQTDTFLGEGGQKIGRGTKQIFGAAAPRPPVAMYVEQFYSATE